MRASEEEDEDDEDEEEERKVVRMAATKDDEEDDDLFASSSDKKTSSPPSKLRQEFGKRAINVNKAVVDNEEGDEGEETKAAAAIRASPPPPPASTPPPPPPPPPPAPVAKKGPNLLDRIFQKPGGGRPTELKVALSADLQTSRDFRAKVATALAHYVPESLFPELVDGGTWASENISRDGGEEAQAAALRAARDDSGLSEQEAADAFAEVANAMLCSVVDSASAVLSSSQSSKNDNDDKAVLSALDVVADFVIGAGAVYGQTVPGAVIEPVQYNGKTKRGNIETLYYKYSKACMSLGGLLAASGLAPQAPTPDGDGVTGTKEMSPEERQDRLGRLQTVFAIKEGKRNSLEQKAMKEVFMNMAKGEPGAGGGDLAAMMEALGGGGGKGGAAGDMMGALSGMMGGGGGGGAGAGGAFDGMPDMSPEEAAMMSAEAVKAVKEQLRDGSITRQDVEELEKIMGTPIRDIVKMMDAGQVDKKKLKELGPEMGELLELFKQLGDIK